MGWAGVVVSSVGVCCCVVVQVKACKEMTPKKQQYLRSVVEKFYPAENEANEVQWRQVITALDVAKRKIELNVHKGREYAYDDEKKELQLI